VEAHETPSRYFPGVTGSTLFLTQVLPTPGSVEVRMSPLVSVETQSDTDGHAKPTSAPPFLLKGTGLDHESEGAALVLARDDREAAIAGITDEATNRAGTIAPTSRISKKPRRFLKGCRLETSYRSLVERMIGEW
jgi:hypothetical protein